MNEVESGAARVARIDEIEGFAVEGQEWDRAIAVLEDAASQRPQTGSVRYNLACALARAGRRDEALEQLGRAVELEARFAAAAQTDDDLESIRDDERFPLPA